jgi:hypothetical protein
VTRLGRPAYRLEQVETSAGGGRDAVVDVADLEQLLPFADADELEQLVAVLGDEGDRDAAALGRLVETARRRQKRSLAEIVLARVKSTLALLRPRDPEVAAERRVARS